MVPDDKALDFSREELETLRRCSRYLQRVATIFANKFGEEEGGPLTVRAANAFIVAVFDRNTTQDEKQEIERLLLLQDPLTRRWMDQRLAILGDRPL